MGIGKQLPLLTRSRMRMSPSTLPAVVVSRGQKNTVSVTCRKSTRMAIVPFAKWMLVVICCCRTGFAQNAQIHYVDDFSGGQNKGEGSFHQRTLDTYLQTNELQPLFVSQQNQKQKDTKMKRNLQYYKNKYGSMKNADAIRIQSNAKVTAEPRAIDHKAGTPVWKNDLFSDASMVNSSPKQDDLKQNIEQEGSKMKKGMSKFRKQSTKMDKSSDMYDHSEESKQDETDAPAPLVSFISANQPGGHSQTSGKAKARMRGMKSRRRKQRRKNNDPFLDTPDPTDPPKPAIFANKQMNRSKMTKKRDMQMMRKYSSSNMYPVDSRGENEAQLVGDEKQEEENLLLTDNPSRGSRKMKHPRRSMMQKRMRKESKSSPLFVSLPSPPHEEVKVKRSMRSMPRKKPKKKKKKHKKSSNILHLDTPALVMADFAQVSTDRPVRLFNAKREERVVRINVRAPRMFPSTVVPTVDSIQVGQSCPMPSGEVQMNRVDETAAIAICDLSAPNEPVVGVLYQVFVDGDIIGNSDLPDDFISVSVDVNGATVDRPTQTSLQFGHGSTTLSDAFVLILGGPLTFVWTQHLSDDVTPEQIGAGIGESCVSVNGAILDQHPIFPLTLFVASKTTVARSALLVGCDSNNVIVATISLRNLDHHEASFPAKTAELAPGGTTSTDSPEKSAPISMHTRLPTRAPTDRPTRAPSRAPTNRPTREPSPAPTNIPTRAPSPAPTNRPTRPPTQSPTNRPSRTPTQSPTWRPTVAPTPLPTSRPTHTPVFSTPPTKHPSQKAAPTFVPPPTTFPTASQFPSTTPLPTASAWPSITFWPTISEWPTMTTEPTQ